MNILSRKKERIFLREAKQSAVHKFLLKYGLRSEAEPYSILSAVGPRGLKIAPINSAVVKLQLSDLRGELAARTFNNLLL